MKREKNTVKKLQEEAKERNISFLKNWSKKFLIKRLEEEDARDEEIRELHAVNKREIKYVTSRPEDIYSTLQKQFVIFLHEYKACVSDVETIEAKKRKICALKDKVYGRLKEVQKKIEGIESSGILGDVEYKEVIMTVNDSPYTIKKII